MAARSSEPVVIVPYDSEWPRTFESLREVYPRALRDLPVAVEHVGSTSVPGLAAKPIIDVVIRSCDDLRDVVRLLAVLGYRHQGDIGVPGREDVRRSVQLQLGRPAQHVRDADMTCSKRTVYVTDLDGTLLGKDARLSDRTRSGLATLLEGGLMFTVASARSVVAMQLMFDGLQLPLPVIEFNGAFISDLTTGRHLATNAIGADVVGEVYRTILSAGCLPFVSTFNGDSDRLYYAEIRNAGMKWYLDDRVSNHDPRVSRTDDLSSRLSEQVVCLTVIDRPEPLEELRLTLADEFGGVLAMRGFDSLYSPGWNWLTVHDARATKDQALIALLRMQGLGAAEVVVFGDTDCDISLFRVADRSFAVANASAGLRSMATDVIGANSEDGVVEFLEREWRVGSSR